MKKAAAVIEKNKLQIIEVWVKKVRKELSAPNQTTDPVLRDHLPLLLDDIISLMKRYENFEFTSELKNFDGLLDNSIGHGRHRSSSSGYDVEQVLKEYIILHRILTAFLKKEDVSSPDVIDLLKYIIENSMLYAIVAFNNSLQEIQQKLLGVLAHDIRNPASIAYSSIGMINQEDEPEKFMKIKNMAKNSIKRVLELLEGVLETVTVQAGEGMTLHLTERNLIKYIISAYEEASAIYANEVILNCDEEEIWGVFDSAMIRRIIENIINNAVKYGGRNSPITISVRNTQEKVFIKIHNYGNPIPEEKQKDIFKFLNSEKGNGPRRLKSWGMGLSLVEAVAKAHGGYLDLESNEKDGTTFTLVLSKTEKAGEVKSALNFESGLIGDR